MKTKFSQYLEGLRGGGKVVGTDQGFVVHLAKAREKMGVFQKEDPAYCFLKWYQAAVVGGAREIFFEMDSDRYVMIIPFPDEPELGELCKAFDGEEADLCRRDRLFLEGLFAATSANLETSISTDDEFHVLSSGGLKKPGWWSRLSSYRKVYKERSVRLTLKVGYSKTMRGNLIQRIQERTRFGPIICYFILDPAGRPTIVEREVSPFPNAPIWKGWFVDYSRKPVLLEEWHGDRGELHRRRPLKLSRPKSDRFRLSLLSPTTEQGDVALLLSLHLTKEARVIPVQHGVTLEPIETPLGYPGLTVAFSADGLKTDLSGFKLTDNEAKKDRIEALRETVATVVEQNLPRIKSLEAREQFRLHPSGTVTGAFLGAVAAAGAAFLLQCLVVSLTALAGWSLERYLRRAEIREAKRQRTETFREEILNRLGIDGEGTSP